MSAATSAPIAPTLNLDELASVILDPNQQIAKEHLVEQGFPQEIVEKWDQIDQRVRNSIALESEKLKKVEAALDNSREETFDIISHLKETLRNTLTSSRRLQVITTTMYVLTFLLGLGLIVVGGIMGQAGPEGPQSWINLVYGAGGLALIITNFITNSPRELQGSRSNYAQLSMAMLGWFNEFVENSNQRIIVVQSSELPIEDKLERLDKLSTAMTQSTHSALQMMEEFAEPVKGEK